MYRWDEKYTTPGTDTVTREGPEVRRNQLVELTHISVVDYTSADKALLIGKKDKMGDTHYFRKEDGTAKYECHLSGRVYLLPGEKPLGSVVTPGTSDVLYFSAYGTVYEHTE